MGQHNCHDAQPGDLIEIDREIYHHWALYIRDGYVINVTPAKVKKQRLKDVLKNDNWCVNKYDGSHIPYPMKEIISSAERWIDREVPYDVLGSNCEHFVTELRYGKRRSDQVRKIVASTVAGAIIASIIIISPTVASAIGKLWRGKIFFKILYI